LVIDARESQHAAAMATEREHRKCRQCEFDLIGLPRNGVCPECGTELLHEIYGDNGRNVATDSVPTSIRKRLTRWTNLMVDPRPTCNIMELDVRDMRRLASALGVLTLGFLLYSSGLAVVGYLRGVFRFTFQPSVQGVAEAMLVSAFGSLLVLIGMMMLARKRIGPITPRYRRAALGALGATGDGGGGAGGPRALKSQFVQNLRWVGEWTPWPVRMLIVALQIVPIIACALGAYYFFCLPGFPSRAADVRVYMELAFFVAGLVQVAACLWLMEVARASGDNSALSKFRAAAFGILICTVWLLGSSIFTAMVGGFPVVIPFRRAYITIILTAVTGFCLIVALFSLWNAARWAPRNKTKHEQREAEKNRRDIERGEVDADLASRMGY